MSPLIPPHAGNLVNLLVDASRSQEIAGQADQLPSLALSERNLCDLELLTTGGFSPLTGFMDADTYRSVLETMRLPSGAVWPLPIMLEVPEPLAKELQTGGHLALRNKEGVLLGLMHVADVWRPDKRAEAQMVFGTTDVNHPGVAYLLQQSHPYYAGGPVEVIELPAHYDFTHLRHQPASLRERFARLAAGRVVAFQTRNPMHRAHVELTRRAMASADAHLLIHPVVGMTKPGDVDHYTRVRCYQHLLAEYPADQVTLSLLPLAMRMGGPREALWHAIIRQNYGCSHFIIGRDHAGPGQDSAGKPFYDPYAAQRLVENHQDELGIRVVPFQAVVYVPGHDAYQPVDEVAEGTPTQTLSGTQLRDLLARDEPIPEWFTYPAIAHELRRSHPPRREQGFCVFFTGLSGAGKSTLAQALQAKLLEHDHRSVTMLDGDIVRTHLSSELGFSRRDRSLNVRRIGFVASEVVRAGGAAICAPIAPYTDDRGAVRDSVTAGGHFVEVHVSTPLEVCETRDRKGLYKKARAGVIKEFTGISDPYEAPERPELRLDTSTMTVDDAVAQILTHLKASGLVDLPA